MQSALIKINNLHALTAFCSKLLPLRIERHGCCGNVIFRTFFVGDPLCVRGRKSLRIENLKEEGDWERKVPTHFGKIVGLDPEEVEVNEENSSLNLKKFIKKPASPIHTKPVNEDANAISSKNKKLNFENLNDNSPLLSLKIPNLKSKKLRYKKKQIMLEGKRLIHEAIMAGCSPIEMYFSRNQDLDNLNIPEKVKLYKIAYKKIQLWSDVVTSQGVLAIFKMPEILHNVSKENTIPLTIICDNIREPGNLGAVLRVAASVGCEKLLLTKGCVDIWEPKVLRSSAGCHFRVAIIHNLNWRDVKNKVKETDRIAIAENPVRTQDFKEVNDSEEIKTFKAESKNYGKDLPFHDYSSLDYSNRHTVIIIGGETHGLSKEAYEFVRERQGVKLWIPMCNQVDSLNTAVALGIVSYEIRRQWELFLKNCKNLENDSVDVMAAEGNS